MLFKIIIQIIRFYEVCLVLILLLFVFWLVDIIWLIFQICCVFIHTHTHVYILYLWFNSCLAETWQIYFDSFQNLFAL